MRVRAGRADYGELLYTGANGGVSGRFG